MALDLNYFLKINNTYGTTNKKDTQLYNLKAQINDRFADTIDFYTISKNGTNQDFLIIRTVDETKKVIKARPNEDFQVGDIIEWNNNKWLVTLRDSGNQVYTSGKMQECNWTLKFQHPTTGIILSYPCITSDKTFAEDENDMITLGANKKSVLLPFDENTALIKNKDDKIWRFFIDKSTTDPTPYELIGAVDTTTFNYSGKGLIYFIVQQDQIQSDDRKDLGICNYKEPVPTPEPPDPDTPTVVVKITSDTTDNEVKLGLLCNFSATFTNELGETVTDIQPEYTIDNPYNGKIVLTDNGDGTASIVVNENSYDLIGNEIELTCTELNSGFYSSIVLTIVGMW